ncbi:tripartite tricarboxylate transporter TctB family protein [Aeromicrobium sp. CTD01-1L150]|uniref:tripartite tricarboxylate transporter TctB family protein n=1 Tax=Aeromicrobium sp. CTD01-1L150 TaxID=3341830 RepID=UPI0035BF6C05
MTHADVDDGSGTRLPSLPVRHLATGLFLLPSALGVWVCIKAVGYGVGSPSSPAAGSWPLFVGLALCVLSVWLLVVRDTESETGDVDVVRALGLWLVVLTWTLLLNYLTFIAVTSACLFVIFKLLGRASWLTSVIVPPTIASLTYVFFSQLLAVPLP